MRIPVLFAVFSAIAPDSRPDRTGGAQVETLPNRGQTGFLAKPGQVAPTFLMRTVAK